MSLDMVGECIFILLDCKSGNIERLLLRFCDENQKRKFCDDVILSAQNRRVMFCLCGIQAALRGQGGASIGPRTISGPLTPG